MVPSPQFINIDLGILTIGPIYLIQGFLVTKAVRSRDYAIPAILITAIAIGASPGIIIGVMDFINLETVIILSDYTHNTINIRTNAHDN